MRISILFLKLLTCLFIYNFMYDISFYQSFQFLCEALSASKETTWTIQFIIIISHLLLDTNYIY